MENTLIINRHVLIHTSLTPPKPEVQDVLANFCGTQVRNQEELERALKDTQALVYVLGDAEMLNEYRATLAGREVRTVKGYTTNIPKDIQHNAIWLGQVPLNLHNVAVYYKEFHTEKESYFQALKDRHHFQSLTESSKSGTSYRKGLYLSEVRRDEGSDDLHFNLLRCSTNLEGPTEGFVDTDRNILKTVNAAAEEHFVQKTNLNHVLAQIYENCLVANDKGIMKSKKAKIKQHSDKTKDMPRSGLITFNTFYAVNKEKHTLGSNTDPYDICFEGASVLTHLRFCLKNDLGEMERVGLVQTFSVPLYPNSLLMISLKTNRLYTHEIIPSPQMVVDLPTRLGYVIRCSETEGIHRDGATFFKAPQGQEEELRKADEEGTAALKALYYKENSTTEMVDYSGFNFSFNEGDYRAPIVK